MKNPHPLRVTGPVTILLAASTLGFSSDQKKPDLASDKGKLSYAIGQQIGRQMKSQGIDIDPDTPAVSIGDALAGKESRLKPEEMQAAVMKARQADAAKQESAGKENREKGDKFLAA